MPGPRDYSAGTERALYLLSRGKCYYPDCKEPVIRFVEDVPVANVQITHIRGAKPGSARFDPSMDDGERAAFSNLILACKPHHDLIDRIDPNRFSVELLHGWKELREGDATAILQGLTGLTEERLADMLESAFRANAPQREISVTITGAIFYDGVNAVSVSPDSWPSILDLNPHLREDNQAVMVIIRNTGYSPVSIESIAIDLVFVDHSGKEQAATLIGANDFPYLNPNLPNRLDVGAPAITWLTSPASIQRFLPALLAATEVEIRATVNLGSGETILTDAFPAAWLPSMG